MNPDVLILSVRSKDKPPLGFCRSAVYVGVVLGLVIMPAATASAQRHRARLSADLADQLAADSPAIEVIVDGDAASIARLARQYNVVVKRSLRRGGAVLLVNAGPARGAAGGRGGRSPRRERQVPVVFRPWRAARWAYRSRRDGGRHRRRPGVGGRGRPAAAVGAGRHGGGDRLGVRPAASRAQEADAADGGLHGRRRRGSVRARHARGGDHRGRGRAHGRTRGCTGASRRARISSTCACSATTAPGRRATSSRRSTGRSITAHEYNIRIINLSLGAPVLQPYRDDPVCEAVERAVRAGIVVVAAAGNYGQDGGRAAGAGRRSRRRATGRMRLTVGAIDTNGTAERSDDTVAPFSSNGPTRYDLVLKPDLVAPGRRMTSAEAVGSLLSANFPERHVAGSGPNAYIQLSGTSMAAAVVSGAAALLLEERPGLQPLTTKAALQLTSTFMPASGLIRGGSGSLNVLAAAEFVRDGDLSDTTIAGMRDVGEPDHDGAARTGGEGFAPWVQYCPRRTSKDRRQVSKRASAGRLVIATRGMKVTPSPKVIRGPSSRVIPTPSSG